MWNTNKKLRKVVGMAQAMNRELKHKNFLIAAALTQSIQKMTFFAQTYAFVLVVEENNNQHIFRLL